jgi:hypothetical protein
VNPHCVPSVRRSDREQALERHSLNLVGEYRVAAELLKRGLSASITCGHVKDIDIYVVGDDASGGGRVITQSRPLTMHQHCSIVRK